MTTFPLWVLSALSLTCAAASAFGAVTDPRANHEPLHVIVMWAFAIGLAGISAGLALNAWGTA